MLRLKLMRRWFAVRSSLVLKRLELNSLIGTVPIYWFLLDLPRRKAFSCRRGSSSILLMKPSSPQGRSIWMLLRTSSIPTLLLSSLCPYLQEVSSSMIFKPAWILSEIILIFKTALLIISPLSNIMRKTCCYRSYNFWHVTSLHITDQFVNNNGRCLCFSFSFNQALSC